MVAVVTASRKYYQSANPTLPMAMPNPNFTDAQITVNQTATILVPIETGAVEPLILVVIRPDGTMYFVSATQVSGQNAVYTFTPTESGWWQIQTLSTQPFVAGEYQNYYLFYVSASSLPFTVAIGVILSIQLVQRSITGPANLPIVAGDSILNVNVATTLAVTVPLASAREGAPLFFKMVIGSALAVLTPTGSDTFDGLVTLTLAAGELLTLFPYNDGVNTGYAVW